MLRLATIAVLFSAATIAFAQELRLPVSAPTLSEFGLAGLGLVVAVAAGITIRRRNRK